MGKRNKNRAAAAHSGATTAEAFSFGDPIPVLDRRELLDYVECVQMDRWYEPPVSFDGLARTYRAAVHHSSPIAVKRNILTSTFIPHPLLSQQAFSRFVQDYLVFGNAYLEKRTNRLGGVLSLEPSLAKYTRRGVDLDSRIHLNARYCASGDTADLRSGFQDVLRHFLPCDFIGWHTRQTMDLRQKTINQR